MPSWVALLLASVAFIALFADSLGGLREVSAVLDRAGFSLGTRRFSLLTVLQIAVTLLILFAIIRLASRVINHSIRRTKGLDATQQLLAQKLAGLGLLVVAFFIGIDIVGIDLTALAVFSGAFGLAVGVRASEDIRQPHRRDHPSDGSVDQAGATSSWSAKASAT
jgi:small-conductance mechanosensitive channel